MGMSKDELRALVREELTAFRVQYGIGDHSNSEWAVAAEQQAREDGFFASKHSVNEVLQYGVFCQVLNNFAARQEEALADKIRRLDIILSKSGDSPETSV